MVVNATDKAFCSDWRERLEVYRISNGGSRFFVRGVLVVFAAPRRRTQLDRGCVGSMKRTQLRNTQVRKRAGVELRLSPCG